MSSRSTQLSLKDSWPVIQVLPSFSWILHFNSLQLKLFHPKLFSQSNFYLCNDRIDTVWRRPSFVRQWFISSKNNNSPSSHSAWVPYGKQLPVIMFGIVAFLTQAVNMSVCQPKHVRNVRYVKCDHGNPATPPHTGPSMVEMLGSTWVLHGKNTWEEWESILCWQSFLKTTLVARSLWGTKLIKISVKIETCFHVLSESWGFVHTYIKVLNTKW